MSKKGKKISKKIFKEILKTGKGFKEDRLIMKIFFSKEKSIKIGFLISKKISKKAVERNRIKRRLKEILKKEKIKEGLYIIFIPLPGLEKKNFKELEETVKKILKKAKVLKHESNR